MRLIIINLITRFQVGTSRQVVGTPEVYNLGLGTGDVTGIPEEGSDANAVPDLPVDYRLTPLPG